MPGADHKFDYTTPTGVDAVAKRATMDAATPGTAAHQVAQKAYVNAMIKLSKEQYDIPSDM